MLEFNHNFTNAEVTALLPYLRAARATIASAMDSEHIIARDQSATAHAALSRVLTPMERHVVEMKKKGPKRNLPPKRGKRRG